MSADIGNLFVLLGRRILDLSQKGFPARGNELQPFSLLRDLDIILSKPRQFLLSLLRNQHT